MAIRRRTSAVCALLTAPVLHVAGLIALSPASAAPADPPAAGAAREGIRVSGTGTASGTPDVLRLDLGVEIRRPAIDAALRDANTTMTRVRDALLRAGVDRADLQTTGMHVGQVQDKDGRPDGYTVVHRLSAKLRDLERAGTAIQSAVAAGGNAVRVESVYLSLEDDEDVLADARRRAFAAAKRKAELYAREAGRGLGAVIALEEVVSHPGRPVPMEADAAASGGVPVERGRTNLAVTVTVDWRFS